jgi:hypothetical protein
MLYPDSTGLVQFAEGEVNGAAKAGRPAMDEDWHTKGSIKQLRATSTGGPELLTVFGGAEGDRTPDLMTASHALSQLSYGP